MKNDIIFSDNNIYEEDFITKVSKEFFGIKYLYPWQRLVISNILEAAQYQKKIKTLSKEKQEELEILNKDSFCLGKQIVLLPTGAGKSLCFQIPSLVLEGATLVIYPLLALMSDQTRRMEAANISTVIFRGGQSQKERKALFDKIQNGAKFIIANPEVLENENLVDELCKCKIEHIVIDEAHCVSEWGDSFRPSYLNLGKVIQKINPLIITAFTATASDSVLNRIKEILFDNEGHLVRSESDRPNILYFVKQCSAKKKEALLLAKTELKPMIIFCGTRAKAQDMAHELNVCFGNGTAKFYHAGLEREEKDYVEKWFYDNKDGILCATCAYGMGVDKKDIKTVIHLEPPLTVEAYIQEAGRGGRDGSLAKAILLWSLEDFKNFSLYTANSRQEKIRNFAMTNECRRQVLLDALGGEKAYCNGCDVCLEQSQKQKLESCNYIKRRIGLQKINNSKKYVDWKIAYNIIKNNSNNFTKEELESKINLKMKDRFLHKMNLNIWNNSDSKEIVKQLYDSNKIMNSNFLWKNRIKIYKKI